MKIGKNKTMEINRKNLAKIKEKLDNLSYDKLSDFLNLWGEHIEYLGRIIELDKELEEINVTNDKKVEFILNRLRKNVHNYSKNIIQAHLDYIALLKEEEI